MMNNEDPVKELEDINDQKELEHYQEVINVFKNYGNYAINLLKFKKQQFINITKTYSSINEDLNTKFINKLNLIAKCIKKNQQFLYLIIKDEQIFLNYVI